MLLAAVDRAGGDVARAHRAADWFLEPHGGVVGPAYQHVIRPHAVDFSDRPGVDCAGSLHALVGRGVVEHDVEGEFERAGVLASDYFRKHLECFHRSFHLPRWDWGLE